MDEIVSRLAPALSPQSIMLFGSYSHGQPTAGSDIDIMIILAGDGKPRWELVRRGWDCLRGLGLPIELHFNSQDRFLQRSLVPGSFEHEVARTARLVYGSPLPDVGASEAGSSPVKAEIVREWLEKAQNERQTARLALEAPRPLTAIAGFHARQAGEQCLRALAQWHEIAVPKMHDLGALLDLCTFRAPAMRESREVRDELRALSTYDETVLYPPAREPSVQDAQSALATADRLCENVLKHLPREVQP